MTGPERQIAVVAGASRGLGLLVSLELAGRGYRVHGCARDAGELAEAATRVDAAAGAGTFVPHVTDVRDPQAVADLVRDVVQTEGRLDVAIHVAGIIQVGPVQTVTLGHFRDAVDTMLWGPVHVALAVLPTMRAAGRGRIGIVSSIGGVISVPRLLPYSVAKFGAVGLAEGLYAELAGTGITVTSITPGLMRTGGHVGATFTGDAETDYAWFAPAASLPLLTISAQRAARRIVHGVLAGRPTVELTPLAIVARRVHGVAPATTVRLLGLVARILPDPRTERDPLDTAAPSIKGSAARRRLGSRVVGALSVLGDRAARRNNESR